MKKKLNNNNNNNQGDSEELGTRQKERHIVSWSQEEDDILREQIRVHGTENWSIIASKFKDKTTRQCRRRWFTYLNSDFKKGGWSPEEDMLLCEAQKIFGNRWTEIAKVVSGRTDNAVKNRFTTLCKKKAKHEALAKENNTSSYINLNNKRIIFQNGVNTEAGSENSVPLKKLRHGEKLAGECGLTNGLLRSPFAVLAQNLHNCEGNFSELLVNQMNEASTDGSENNNSRGTFLKKDDPKVLALMQQAELLSSLAMKVNSEKTEQSLESAWVVLQDFLKQNQEIDPQIFKSPNADFQLENFKELMEGLRSNNGECSISSWRQADMYESSPANSEYSTGSTLLSNSLCDPENGHELKSEQLNDQNSLPESGIGNSASKEQLDDNILICDGIKATKEGEGEYFNIEFSSPHQVTPIFGALAAAAIPSPKFSESEKHFLMKALGMESTPTPTNQITNPSKPPQCKRSLLHCL